MQQDIKQTLKTMYENLSKYGIDQPLMPISLLTLSGYFATRKNKLLKLFGTSAALAEAGIYLRTSLKGKYDIWQDILEHENLNFSGKALDLGCGRGAVLNELAKKMYHPDSVIGIDIFDPKYQSGNNFRNAQQNVIDNKIADKVTIKSDDITELAFDDESFDIITASFVLHNLSEEKQKQALLEACRVLSHAGKLIIVDLTRNINLYQQILMQHDINNLHIREVGIDGWWSGPWISSSILIANK